MDYLGLEGSKTSPGDIELDTVDTGKDYGEIANLINTFPERGSKEHNYALEILKEVKVKTALVNLIPEYLEFYKRF